METEFRESGAADDAGIDNLYPQAFPEEDLLPLVHELLRSDCLGLSLLALRDNNVLGHLAFTNCSVPGLNARVVLLGPLAVAPNFQKQGVGTALINESLQRLKERGVARVQVLGDPGYYQRFGFERDTNVAPPYRLPEDWADAWRYLDLRTDNEAVRGVLDVPAPWRREELWT